MESDRKPSIILAFQLQARATIVFLFLNFLFVIVILFDITVTGRMWQIHIMSDACFAVWIMRDVKKTDFYSNKRSRKLVNYNVVLKYRH